MSPFAPLLDLLLALCAGALIGIERSFRGRAAGPRTYGMVCMGSALFIVLTRMPPDWFANANHTLFNIDPTRVVQGIVTGIGFLGAGVIIKEEFSVRGLTTAAAVWTTSVVGIVIGAGYWGLGMFATLAVLGVLSGLRAIETRMLAQHYVHCEISFHMTKVLEEAAVCQLLQEHHFRVNELNYEKNLGHDLFTYRATAWTWDTHNVSRLAAVLRGMPNVCAFRIFPSRD
jgi:putative Mg2+ transporter-C (MgtC) family protein